MGIAYENFQLLIIYLVAMLTTRIFPAALLAALLSLSTLAASSANASANSPMVPDAARNVSNCWNSAAEYHNVDVWLLYSIAWVESRFNPSAKAVNKNGSTDLGLMQINSIWLPELRKHGITKAHLLDGCSSVYVGAWILSKNIKKYGYTWKAIGAYNSRTPSIGFRYAKKVYETHRSMTGIPTEYIQTRR